VKGGAFVRVERAVTGGFVFAQHGVIEAHHSISTRTTPRELNRNVSERAINEITLQTPNYNSEVKLAASRFHSSPTIGTVKRMAQPATLGHSLHPRLERSGNWIVLGCVLVLFAAIRYRLRDIPLERDEGEFAYGGQLLLQGIWPGEGLYTMKFPGTHAAYTVLITLFGQTATGVHIGFTVVNALTILLLFLLARAALGKIAAGVTAATYGLLSLCPDVLGTSAHATHFVVLFAVGGLLQLWYAQRTPHAVGYLSGGFLLSCSVLMKHCGIAFVAFGLLCVTCSIFSKKPRSNLSAWKPIALFVIGMTLPFALLLLTLWLAGTLENYWFWGATYARAYAKPNPGAMLVWLSLTHRMPASLAPPFYIGLAGLLALWITHGHRKLALVATAFLAFSLLAIVPGLHFRQHYYIVLIPAIALLIGALIQRISDVLALRASFLSFIPVAAFTAFFAWEIVNQRNFFFIMTPTEACRSLYGFQPFPEAIVLATHIQEHSNPDARITVLGSEPEIYFYARRRSATGYVYTYPLAENQPFADQMRVQMQKEIEAGQPQYIVQVRSWASWLSRPSPQKHIDDLCEALMPAGYKLIAVCQYLPDQSKPVWHWPPATLPDAHDSSSQLLLFERENRPFDAPR